jgi:glutamyl-tRNA reductase
LTAALPLWSLSVTADSAPAEVRDQVDRLIQSRLQAGPDLVLLKTCHRVEAYGLGKPPDISADLEPRTGVASVRHLLRVASGLESAVVGEDEVLHQVREANRLAHAAGRPDTRLHRLFETAVAAGRDARAGRTASGAGLPDRAIEWLGQRSSLSGRPVLVAGAGRMGSALAHAAARAGARIAVASRDAARARRLARVHGGEGGDLAWGVAFAGGSAGVAIALCGEWRELAGLTRPWPSMADISAPSAVPAAVRDRLKGGFLGVDDLFHDRRPPPRGFIAEAERIVATKTAEYMEWLERRG